MILRPYQQRAVNRGKKALVKSGNTILVAPTGSGKTIMLSALIGAVNPRKALVLQHRDELVSQNMTKFLKVNPGSTVSTFNASQKSWRGQAVFAMVQTLCRDQNLKTLPKIDLTIIDEAHHVAANTYRKIIQAVKDINPKCKIAGFTATPMRSDKKGLRAVFDNCADKITIRELIDLGFLVTPKAFVIDIEGVRDELSQVRKLASDFDPGEVEKVLNKRVINDEVVKNWKEKAGDRKTIVFCSTIKHAQDVCKNFRANDVTARIVTGEMAMEKRRARLRRFTRGDIQVIVNVGVLVEGFDDPTVSAVVLLRPCSFKSTMIQMIGRGLRPVNAQEHPGVIKKDCVVLDFGASLLTHGDIDAEVDLGNPDGDSEPNGDAPFKYCPDGEHESPYMLPDVNGRYGCGAEVPAGVINCPFCGFRFERVDGDDRTPDAVRLTEIDLMNRSPFRWVDLFKTGRVLMASGFDTWAAVVSPDGENWYSIGKRKESKILDKLGVTGKAPAFAMADDFLRENETSRQANKARRWLTDPASKRQGELLTKAGYQVNMGVFGCANFTKLTATAHLNFAWNRRKIEYLIGV